MELMAHKGKQGGSVVAGDGGGPDPGLAALMDELAHGMLLVSGRGHLLYANQAARQELLRASVISLWQGGFVQACRPEFDRDLQGAIGRAVTGRRSLVHLQALEGPGLSISASPVRSRPGDPPRCALVLSRQEVCDALMLGFFARRHGITPTEQQVLAILCEGCSAPEIAAQLSIAVSTARSHIRSLCAKTRTKSVRELVRRISVLPPIAPTFPQPAIH